MIYQFFDAPFACPQCGVRLEIGDQIDEDQDGPIFQGECPAHGTFKVQAANEDTECEACGDTDCDFDCDGPYDADEEPICTPTGRAQ